MEHIAAIMLLVGCSQGNLECRELEAPVVAFEAAEECRDMLRPSIAAARTGTRVVYGACAEVDPALFVEDATIEWDFTPKGALKVHVIIEDADLPVMVAEKAGRNTVLNN